ncbi:MAG: carbamoyltransferase C-terminal domain-containing protein [Nanoarchaeota archaeon]
MIILGLYEGHNGTAALMKDGKIIAAASEERFTRVKNEMSLPVKAAQYCLKAANITIKDVDVVAAASIQQNLIWNKIKRESTYKIEDYAHEQHVYFKPLLLEKKDPVETLWNYVQDVEKRKGVQKTYYDYSGLNKKNLLDNNYYQELRLKAFEQHLGVDRAKVRFMEHHEAHAAYAYYSSPFRGDTLVLTADGVGDFGINATVSVAKDDKVTRIFASKNCNIVRIWRYMTLLLGMKPVEHEYKVMGLAPYANSRELERAYKVFGEVFKLNGLEFEYKNRPTDLYFYFKDKLEGCRFDGIAGALQKMTEEVFTDWVKAAVAKTGIKRVVFAGGLAMNIKLNLAIIDLPEVEEFYVGANPGDESDAIGVCYMIMAEHCEKNGISKKCLLPLPDVYLGPSFTSEDVLAAIKETKVEGKYEVRRNVTNREVAKLISEGEIIGVCRGRMEFGARALGNRSILADPSKPGIVRKINTQIKYRDFWMPFTPTLLADRGDKYLINPKHIDSPFMTVGFNTKPVAHTQILQALHPEDLTARPQLVTKQQNPDYYDLISEFEKITGIGGILNTSLNLHGHPVVCHPRDAIEVMEKSDLDMMYFGEVLMVRKR